jgi:hypothetical protein
MTHLPALSPYQICFSSLSPPGMFTGTRGDARRLNAAR